MFTVKLKKSNQMLNVKISQIIKFWIESKNKKGCDYATVNTSSPLEYLDVKKFYMFWMCISNLF